MPARSARRILGGLVPVLFAAGLGGCDGSRSAAPTTTASPTYLLPARPARPFETPLATAGAASGLVSFQVMGLRVQMLSLIGTHAELESRRGQFVRVRVAVENTDTTFHDVPTKQQLLVTADGATHQVSYEAMLVTRQPDVVSLGARDRIELDLWYDLVAADRPRALRVRIADGPPRDIPLPNG